MEDYEALRRELTQLSLTRSKSVAGRPGIPRALSRRKSVQTRADRQQSLSPQQTRSTEAGEAEAEESDDFQLGEFLREGHFEKRSQGTSDKKVGVIYKNLTVKGTGSNTTFVRTLPDAVLGTFGPDLYRIITRFLPFLAVVGNKQQRTLINDFTGLVRDGEMMLVLGRPGAGCTTFLKAISNNREDYASVSGDVSYGGIPAAKQKKQYRGEVNYNPETDEHFAEMNVWQTLLFALRNKSKKRERGDIPVVADALMRMFGISHTKYTKVSMASLVNPLYADGLSRLETSISGVSLVEKENGYQLQKHWRRKARFYVGITGQFYPRQRLR